MDRKGRFAGICLQGLILGILLFIAVVMLFAMQSDVRLFRYQGF